MDRQCKLCASRSAVTLERIANGSSVAVCLECATRLRAGMTRRSKVELVEQRLLQPQPPVAARAPREQRSSPQRTATPGNSARAPAAPNTDATKRICIECRKNQPPGKQRVCSSCRRRRRKKRSRELAKLHGQELARAHKNRKNAKGNPCFTARQVRGRIVQGGLPSLGKRG